MNFVLLVNKEKNKTSRDMVNELNHIFDMKKIGHTGTLDPIATGVLVMCGGRYTKLIDKLSCLEKEYIAQIKIGIKTDTGDITGNILDKRECTTSIDDIKKVLDGLIGTYEQIVPKYSAKKVNGKKLYEYARNNEEVPIIKNIVQINNIELISFENDIITIKCLVSKGTYIRSIIQTICDNLKIIGTMNNLVRTKQGPFSIDDSYTIEEIRNGKYKFLDIKELLNIYTYELNDNEYSKVKNGNKVSFELSCEEVLLTYKKEYIAIYRKDNELYIPEIML